MNNKKPTVAFFGSSLVSAYWNGAATYYRGIIKYLHRLGYHVTFYEPDAYDRQQHRDLPDPDWAKSVVYENNSLAVAQAVNDAAGADILIKASGVGVFDEFLEKALVEIKKPQQTIIFWDVDAPATLDSVFNGIKSDFRNLIPQYDYVFTYGGGTPVVDAYNSLKAKKCIPIYNALDPETHYKVPSDPAYACDLAFLGNRLPDREERVYQFFIDVAARLPDHKFILGGSGWDIRSLPPNIKYVGHVYTNEHNAFNSSPRVILNISRQSMADYGFSPATRVFEAAGAGACIITDFWAGVENFFVPESEIWVAHEGYDVVSLLKWIDTEEAEKTGNAALAKVLSEHTYKQRAEQIDDILLGKKTFAANQ
jgi:spore maturation protein CgeB